MADHPAIALLLAGSFGVLLFFAFRPVRGFVWGWQRMFRIRDRINIEDSLKHLYDFEYRRHPCTLESLSGALDLPRDSAVRLLQRLEQMKLVSYSGGDYKLTPDGRRDALRVIRIHRLWERYFSEETGIAASEWHIEAEHREHRTTQEQAAALAARMGHPRYDPHGDPIPTESGDIAAPRGVAPADLEVGALAEVVHVEDEPQAIYDQLLAEGLHPGMRVRIAEISPTRIRLESDAETHALAPIVAANLSVVELHPQEADVGPVERLSALQTGERGRVTGISNLCRGRELRRLLDLGIVPGTVVVAEFSSPAGDPTAYRVRGGLLALRNDQADLIHIDRMAGEAGS